MLERLTLQDLALIERAEIELAPGLNVITGETGAGKSLLVQALELVLGHRADAGVVRDGVRAARVQAEFRLAGPVAAAAGALLAEWGVEFDGATVIVRREVLAEGGSRARVNETSVTIRALERLGEVLADLHGQHEHQSLLRAGAPVETLDRLAGLGEPRARWDAALATWREAAAETERIQSALASVTERRAALEDAAHEIDAAHLEAGEEARLRESAARLAHAERLRELVARAAAALEGGEGGAVDALGAARHAVEQAAALDPSLGDVLPALDEARIAAGEAARALGGYGDRLDAEPADLEAVESRRELLARLGRKHRRTVDELLAWREELRAELALAEDGASAIAAARARLDQAEAECLTAGRALSRRRAAAAREWSAKLTQSLKPLGFPHARIEFAVTSDRARDATAFRAHGFDDVELAFAPNAGEAPRPLRKIASGGELSRIMLALKSALQSHDSVDLLIFDEVDSGVGGAVAQAVGERLAELARRRQVLCVTHLPIVAACAGCHLRVHKAVTDGRTVARIETLAQDQRVEEIARMLAGTRATPTTFRQARELLHATAAR